MWGSFLAKGHRPCVTWAVRNSETRGQHANSVLGAPEYRGSLELNACYDATHLSIKKPIPVTRNS